ncbi:MAG: SufS family cysteine desulfurase [Phycisphaera sp.]|nr:SufS family cysteine desulfurase [Phycisphaera sp.]
MRDTRDDFPLLKRRIDGHRLVYLDSAATSLKPQAVIDAVTRFYTHHTANVHRAVHTLAEEATELYEDARRSLARFIHAHENEIVFTRGSTESINLVRHGMPGLRRTLTTTLEHHSNLLPWGYEEQSTVVSVDRNGQFDMQALEAALKQGVDLVAFSHVSNALGTVQPVKELTAKAHAAGALVLLDAAQSVPHMPVNVKDLGVDFMVFSAHKMLGPGGVGALYGKIDLLERMGPWQLGGHIVDGVHLEDYDLQEPPHRFEAGTPAIEAVIGWGAAVEYLSDLGMSQVRTHDLELVAYALQQLAKMPSITLLGPTDPERRCGSVSFHVKGLEAHGVARMLSNRSNILVRSGFHCAQPLHESLGLLPSVRASFYIYNTREDIDALCEALKAIVTFL